jgi:hypothetical protein
MLETVLTDRVGLVPYTDKWLRYWDRQYAAFFSGEDENATRPSGVAEYRTVMTFASENPKSLTRKALEEERENRSQTASAA